MITVYSNQASANCFKVRLLLHQLEIPFRVVEIDILKERPVDFLAKNPGGKVPFVELEDGTGLTESDAMLYYFAQGSALWPSDRLERTRVLQWMFFEQNEHEPNIAVARFWCGILGAEKEYEAALVDKRSRGNRALARMNRHLETNDFFAADRYTIADIALYGYTHVAGEGGFDLSQYPAIERWLRRVEEQPGYMRM